MNAGLGPNLGLKPKGQKCEGCQGDKVGGIFSNEIFIWLRFSWCNRELKVNVHLGTSDSSITCLLSSFSSTLRDGSDQQVAAFQNHRAPPLLLHQD